LDDKKVIRRKRRRRRRRRSHFVYCFTLSLVGLGFRVCSDVHMELALVSGFLELNCLCFSNEPISHEINTFFSQNSPPLFWVKTSDKILSKKKSLIGWD